MRHAIERANHRGDRSLIVRDSASAFWGGRACELLGIEPILISAELTDAPWQWISGPENFCRDRLNIALADRIDASYIRPAGTIYRLLRERIEQDAVPSVQVLLTPTSNDATKQLIAAGAIGYWLNEPVRDAASIRVDAAHDCLINHQSVSRSLVESPDRWLIHSTRQRSGPWPGQSQSQFNDWLLLSPPVTEQSSPLETLKRIVSEARLVGSHRTTQSKDPVVCFTSLPINQWLHRRKYRSHLGRWDCEPYGIAINRDAALRMGVAPVVYGERDTIARVQETDRWRFQATGSTFDWTEEQEWRARGIVDLKKFEKDEVVVFVNQRNEVSLMDEAPWPVISVQDAGFVTR